MLTAQTSGNFGKPLFHARQDRIEYIPVASDTEFLLHAFLLRAEAEQAHGRGELGTVHHIFEPAHIAGIPDARRQVEDLFAELLTALNEVPPVSTTPAPIMFLRPERTSS